MWGWEQYFSVPIFKKKFHCFMKMIDFSYWFGSMGNMCNYLICFLFSEYIFLLGRERGDGRVGTGEWGWESEDGNIAKRAWKQEQLFSMNLFCLKIILL